MKHLFRNDPLFADFFEFAGGRAFWATVLIILGGLLEGFGLLMLIPVVGIILSETETQDIPIITEFFQMIGADSSGAKLAWVVISFAILMVCRQAVMYRREIMMADLEYGFTASVRHRVFDLIAKQPWEISVGLENGRIAHSLGRDLDRSTESAGFWLRMAGLGFSFAVQIIIAVTLAPWVTLGVIIFVAVVFALLLPMRTRARTMGENLSDTDFEMFSSITEFLRGLKPAKAHGLEKTYLTDLGSAADGYARTSLRFRREITLSNAAIQSATLTVGLGALLIGHLWLETPTATLVVVLLILSRLSGPLKSLQMMLQFLAHARTAYTSLLRHTADLEKTKVEAQGRGPVAPWPKAPSFSLRDICWQAPGMTQPILQGVTAEIPAGRVTAIAGPSGAGKTTLCDLLVGLYGPTGGEILLNGEPYDQRHRNRVQAVLSYVGQEAGLLQPTIREMLTWGTDGASDDEIWAELERVGIAGQVAKESDGLDHQLRGDVSRFSGGERQRLRLARALLRKPKLIVLDEASNALDPISESAILQRVFAVREGATVIMVSHREETVRMADHVIRLEVAPTI
ncbi:MAG: ABC transporter ATP-binding protein [Pseudomonadota bacterium]